MTRRNALRSAATAILVSTALILGALPASADVGPWRTLGSDHARALDESQGLATIIRDGNGSIRYTGIGTIPLDVRTRGWDHVGDPGSRAGVYVEPYQSSTLRAKMFRVQTADGRWAEYVHQLESWEAINNSFAAVSPDARWLVSGEWGEMNRLLVFPNPGVAVTDPGKNLPYAFAIRLDRTVSNLQGCEFTSATQLLCPSDGPGKQLLQVDLDAALGGTDVRGVVRELGQLPLQSGCSGSFEVEGIDYDFRDGTLRVVVLSPSICVAFDSKTWRFRR
ncbi:MULTISPECIES: hypothetical protein [unclassified Crossiella]|uniref:hypothetical protein n=1 Tax=unclassified Crossiella TaxID=2620835 RepID=UPI001FFFF00B|nr:MULTISPECIES: hypothetical protein [unclassified Crossiella]MCK2239576.1 hypothetical protein [Crossiella sp. S99.2]MCK2252271.1 hypothetical protein [Crossiella sp. S99.1]